MQIVCAWCKKVLGEKQGRGVSHGIWRRTRNKKEDIYKRGLGNNL